MAWLNLSVLPKSSTVHSIAVLSPRSDEKNLYFINLSVIPVDYLTEILAENIIFIKVKEISESHNL